MANQQGNGRNVAVPDENRPSWRPQDENGARNRRSMSDEDDERYISRDDDRYGRSQYWQDRSSRWDRDEGRVTERYGQGQSGYGAGGYEDDRGFSSRNQAWRGDERARERGLDDRFSRGSGGASWGERESERSTHVGGGGYGHGGYQESGGYLGQGGQQMGSPWGNEGYMDQRGQGMQGRYGQPGEGMYGQSGMRGERMYGQRGEGRYGQRGQRDEGMYGQRGQRGEGMSGQRGMRGEGMYGQRGEGMYGQRGEGMYGQRDEGMYGQRDEGMYGQGYGGSMNEGSYGERGMYGQREGMYGQREGMYGQGFGQDSSFGNQSGYGSTGNRPGHQPGGMYGHGPGSWSEGQRYSAQGSQTHGGQPQTHRGKGPAGYTRSDERVREIVCEALTEDHNIDATNIEVTVKNGEVTLSGTVEDRMQKRMAEDLVDQLAGVKDVQNQIRVTSDIKKTSGKEVVTNKEAESITGQDKRHRA